MRRKGEKSQFRKESTCSLIMCVYVNVAAMKINLLVMIYEMNIVYILMEYYQCIVILPSRVTDLVKMKMISHQSWWTWALLWKGFSCPAPSERPTYSLWSDRATRGWTWTFRCPQSPPLSVCTQNTHYSDKTHIIQI